MKFYCKNVSINLYSFYKTFYNVINTFIFILCSLTSG